VVKDELKQARDGRVDGALTTKGDPPVEDEVTSALQQA